VDPLALLLENSREVFEEYTTKYMKMAIMLGMSPNNLDVLLKYMGGTKPLEELIYAHKIQDS